jgi:hypothetical protein
MGPRPRLSTISLRQTEARLRIEPSLRRTGPGLLAAPASGARHRPEQNAGQTAQSARSPSTGERTGGQDQRWPAAEPAAQVARSGARESVSPDGDAPRLERPCPGPASAIATPAYRCPSCRTRGAKSAAGRGTTPAGDPSCRDGEAKRRDSKGASASVHARRGDRCDSQRGQPGKLTAVPGLSRRPRVTIRRSSAPDALIGSRDQMNWVSHYSVIPKRGPGPRHRSAVTPRGFDRTMQQFPEHVAQSPRQALEFPRTALRCPRTSQ